MTDFPSFSNSWSLIFAMGNKGAYFKHNCSLHLNCRLEVVLHAELNLSTAENLAKLTGRFREVADGLREVSRRKVHTGLGRKFPVVSRGFTKSYVY